jgi:hypothetical protein
MPEGKLRCAICQHVDRAKIEAQFQAGTSLRRIAEQFAGTSAWSIRRHCGKHMQRPQATTVPAAVGTTGPRNLEEAIHQALAEQFAGQDFIRRPQLMRLARSVVAQAVAGRSAALHLLFARLWPEAKPSMIGELVVNNQVGIGINAGEGKPRTEAERNAWYIAKLRDIYGLSESYVENRAKTDAAVKADPNAN